MTAVNKNVALRFFVSQEKDILKISYFKHFLHFKTF